MHAYGRQVVGIQGQGGGVLEGDVVNGGQFWLLFCGPKQARGFVFRVDRVEGHYHCGLLLVDEPPKVAQRVGHGLLRDYEPAGTAETVHSDGVDVGGGVVVDGVA